MSFCISTSIRSFIKDFIFKNYTDSILNIPKFKDSLDGHLNWLLDELEEEKFIKKISNNIFFYKGELNLNIVYKDLIKNEIILIEVDKIQKEVINMRKQKQIDELRDKINLAKKASLTFPMDKFYRNKLNSLNMELKKLLKGK